MASVASERTVLRSGPWIWLAGAALLWGVFSFGPRFEGDGAPPLPTDFVAAQSMSSDGQYLFFSFRRGVWRINKTTRVIQYFGFPEPGEVDGAIEPSRSYRLTSNDFPLDRVHFQVSARNLTNYLWVLNPQSGKAMFLKARRDGLIEASPVLPAE